MNGIQKSFELVCQISPLPFAGAILSGLFYLIDPWLLLLLVSPVSIHLWSGFFYGADRGNSQWTWRSRVLALLALLQLPTVFVAISAKVDELAGFIWLYGIVLLVWTIAAWAVGGMALVDDWM
jgi:hypothetical protein